MLLAQEYDAVEDGTPYVSTHRRRLVAPDTRSRVVGYLGTAPVAAPGYRTDGEWVWPEMLADHARVAGVAPQEQLYEHMRQRSFLLPDEVGESGLVAAVAAIGGPSVPDPPPEWDWIHLGGFPDRAAPAEVLLRIRLREDGSVAESAYVAQSPYGAQSPFDGTGWQVSDLLRSALSRRSGIQFVEISGREAADLNNGLCAKSHDALLARARESEPPVGILRVARVFDGEAPAGTPWFSPYRLRIPEQRRRERLAAYLAAGRLVVRATGRVPDPVDPREGEPIPLSYRTDGTWVWQESLAHYVRTRGVAPELEFLCHIEARGYQLSGTLPAGIVPRAGAAVKGGPPPRLARAPVTYHAAGAAGILRRRGRGPGTADELRADLRWGPAAQTSTVDGSADEISEADAVDHIDARWAAGTAVPPLD
jgi:hypothetical protein